ncbi:MAG: FAD-dependent oxidoreductase [Pseudomonadota bacterium]
MRAAAPSAAQPPSQASVVVIGGGVMGCSTLYHLAKAGVTDAVLLERHQLTAGTTWHSAAQVRALRSSRNLTALIRYSIELYQSLEVETGQATGWIQNGSLSIATTPERLIHIERQAALAGLYGVAAEMVSAEEAQARWPLMNGVDVLGAAWSPEDGRVSPSDLCAALAKGARARGGTICEGVGVEAILTEGGRVRGVETSAGAVRCDAVALCGGLWSRSLGASAGVEIPLWPCEHFYLLTKPVEGVASAMPTLSDHDGHLYIRDESGGFLVGCFEPMGKPIDPERLGDDFAFQLLPEDWDHFEPMMLNALHRLPALETAEVRMLLNGPESFTPDGAFLLGETAETEGLFLGCGMNSVGVASAGGAGMALAQHILTGRTPFDLHELEPNRFHAALSSASALAARAPEVLGKHYEIAHPGRQWAHARDLRRTPLHDEWVRAGALFGQVYGFERPLYFGAEAAPRLTFGRPDWFDAVGREVAAAHEAAALFDLSSFGKIEVAGRDAAAFLNRVCANQMDRPPGRVIYTAMLNQAGGVVSDLTAIRLSETRYRLYVGTAAIKRDCAWLRRALAAEDDVALEDVTERFAVIGVMGPEAARVAERIGAPALNAVPYFRAAEVEIAGAPALAARLSYVGEAGWEITSAAAEAPKLYAALAAAGAQPAGLFAQTSMRIEKGFLAYGHDLDEDVTPLEAGLAFAVAWDTPFIGRKALSARRERGVERRLVTLLFEDADVVPIGLEPVLRSCAGAADYIGATTSAAFGYRVGRPVALASIRAEAAAEGASLAVAIGARRCAATVRLGPAFDPDGTRLRRL